MRETMSQYRISDHSVSFLSIHWYLTLGHCIATSWPNTAAFEGSSLSNSVNFVNPIDYIAQFMILADT